MVRILGKNLSDNGFITNITTLGCLLFHVNMYYMIDKRTLERILSDFNRRHGETTKLALAKLFSTLSKEEIEDIMQEAQIVLWQSICVEKVDNNLYPYFFKTCKNLCLKEVRRKGQHPETLIGERDEEFQKDRICMDKVDLILQVTDENDENRMVMTSKVLQVLNQMTGRCKQLLWHYYAEELSWGDIANLTGLRNATTAKSAGSRCRQTFRAKFNE